MNRQELRATIERPALRQALNYLANGKVKGRNIRARRV